MSKRIKNEWFLVVVLLWETTSAIANVTILPTLPGVTSVFNSATGKFRVTISRRPSISEFYTIEGNAGDTIEYIRVNFLDDGSTIDPLRTITLNIHGTVGTPGIANIEELDRPNGSGQVRVVQLEITGNVGRADITTDRIRAHIIENAIIGGSSHALWGGLAAPASGNARFNNIRINGDATDDIIEDNGPLNNFVINGALVGTSGNPSLIEARDGSNSLTIGSMNNGQIGRENLLTFMSVQSLRVLGSVTGSGGVYINSVDTAIIDGNLETPFSLATILPVGTSGVNNRPILIGESLASSGSINLPSAGAKSQIIINNNASPASTWAGTVNVGTTTLSGPSYINIASSLGDGAVGLVPFRLHATDSTPAGGAALSLCERPSLISMRHYGPVIWTVGADPFVVERRAIGAAPSVPWADHSACFAQARDSANTTIVNLTAPTALQTGFEYRVRLRKDALGENILRCDIAGQPPVADHAGDHVFTVGDLSLGDANSDGVVNFADITSVESNWLASGCLFDGDATRNGVVDFGDITSVLSNWLASYGDCTSGLAASFASTEAAPTMDDAIVAMGFGSATEYAVFLADLDAEQAAMVVGAVNAWIGGDR